MFVCLVISTEDMMGVHLKVQGELEKKKNEILASGQEFFPLTEKMITSSCFQVLMPITGP